MASYAQPQQMETSVLQQLSTLDRFLPVWIGLAMVIGIGLGRLFPDLNDTLDDIKIDQTSLPIAIGLLGMMYPVLAKVKYNRLGAVTSDRPMVMSSLLLNWVVGPALMFALAWIFLSDLPEFRTGLILVGLARCIAMVLIWNNLACGDTEAAAVLVVLNSVFQVAAYALLGYFYLELLPGWLGLQETSIDFDLWAIAKSVLDLPRHPTGRRVRHQPHRAAAQGRRVVRERVPAAHRAVRPVQPAVHDRGALRDPG